MASSQSRKPRYGPVPMWDEPLDPCKIHWPESHRALYQDKAEQARLSFNQYVIRAMAQLHNLQGPRGETQLTLQDTDGGSKKLAS